MDDGGRRAEVGSGLKDIVVEYSGRGTDLSTDPRLAEAILLDSFPEAPAEIRALVEAIRSGAIQYMRDRAAQGAEFSIHGSASQLSESAGLRDDLARWAVETWWNALSIGAPIQSSRSGPATAAATGAAIGAAAAVVPPPRPPSPPPSMPPAQPMAASTEMTESAIAPATGSQSSTDEHGYPTASPLYPTDQQGYPTDHPGYPAVQPGYATGPYPTGQTAYPTGQQPHPAGQQSYPAASPPPFVPGAPQYPSGPSGAPPSAPKRPQGRIVAVIVVVVVILAYVGIAAAAHLPPFKSSTSTTTSTTTFPTSSTRPPTSTTRPVTSTTNAALSSALAAAIPNATSCTALSGDQTHVDAPTASAAVRCTPVNGLSVLYAIFATRTLASAEYTITIKQDTSGLSSGFCNQKNNVTGSYVNTSTGAAIGSLSCFTLGSGQALFWWHFSDNIVALATSQSLTLAKMYKDWANLGPT